ncbi:MAG TPA: hypothetical protein VKQ72_04185 [Aggregatilineales bacterium]|nr:hypothetical protein [Aggregatilineales bacterium]
MAKKGDDSRTLLRRLLNQAEEKASGSNGAQEGKPDKKAAPPATQRATGEASPVRPTPPQVGQPPAPLSPQPRSTQTTAAVPASPIEDRLQAEESLENLRAKTAQIANEFAEGKLNHAQFSAMYSHYNEKRMIIERLLARDPNTHAWQSVARAGHTTFLRQHFEARILCYAIYDFGVVDPATPLAMQGPEPLPVTVAKPVLTALNVMIKTRISEKPMRALQKPIDGGHWIAIVPGKFTVALAHFSLEPSPQQFSQMLDIHADFERANRVTLEHGIRTPEQLVFPHRALFEQANS